MDMEEVNIEICKELTVLKLELLEDYDINYRPGYRVVLEENLQGARDYGLKEYKSRKREIEGKDIQEAIDYLHVKEVEYQNAAERAKAQKTEDHDYPIREYWSYVASSIAMKVLSKQITDSNTTKL